MLRYAFLGILILVASCTKPNMKSGVGGYPSSLVLESADSLLLMGCYDEANDLVTSYLAEQHTPEEATTALFIQTKVALALEKSDAALVSFVKGLSRLTPEHSHLQSLANESFGDLAHALGKDSTAYVYWTKAYSTALSNEKAVRLALKLARWCRLEHGNSQWVRFWLGMAQHKISDSCPGYWCKFYREHAAIAFDEQQYLEAETYARLWLAYAKIVQSRGEIAKAFNMISNTYNDRELLDKALVYLDSSILGADSISIDSGAFVDYHHNKSVCCARMCQYEKALKESQLAWRFSNPTDSVYLLENRVQHAICCQYLEQYQLGLKFLSEVAPKYEVISDLRDIGAVYYFYLRGILRNLDGQLFPALEDLQKALVGDIEGFDALDWRVNPTISDLKKTPYAFVTLAWKADVFSKLHSLEPGNPTYTELAEECFALLDTMFIVQVSEIDQELLIRTGVNQHLVCAFALRYFKQRFEETGDNKYFYNALKFIDNNHATQLKRDKLVATQWYENDRRKWVALHALQDDISKQALNGHRTADLEKKLIVLLKEMKGHKNKVSKSANLGELHVDLDTLQAYCKQQEAIALIYHEHGKLIYGISVGPQNIQVVEIARSIQFGQDVSLLDKALREGSTDVYAPLAAGHRLYESILKPLLKDSSLAKRLVVVPDTCLAKIPFDVMLTAPPRRDGLRQQPYVLRKFAVSYASSLSMLGHQAAVRKERGQGIAAFSFSSDESLKQAASMAMTRQDLVEIPGAKKEVDFISGLFDRQCRAYYGAVANKPNLMDELGKADIIHLALHGSADASDYLRSQLYFNVKEDNNLAAFELYRNPIKARLVVLPACESGAGLALAGEGTFSMARAFEAAGCPTVVMSLWKNNDYASPKLMRSFYQNLQSGLPVDESMQKAKLAYLESEEEGEMLEMRVWGGEVVRGRGDKQILLFNTLQIIDYNTILLSLLLLFISTVLGMVLWRKIN